MIFDIRSKYPLVVDYKSDVVTKDYLGDGKSGELEDCIGKKVVRIENTEYCLKVFFADGSWLEASGSRWDDSALGVEVGGR